jgi:hypothetical protein
MVVNMIGLPSRIHLTTGSLALSLLGSLSPVEAAANSRDPALAFDAFPIFDPRPIFALAEELFPGKRHRKPNPHHEDLCI